MENGNGNFYGGANYYQPAPVNPAPAKKRDVASLVLGIVSLVSSIEGLAISWYPFVGLIGGIIAIVTGAIAKKRNPQNKMAKAGLIMGIIATILGVLCIIAFIVLIALGIAGDLGSFDLGELGSAFDV